MLFKRLDVGVGGCGYLEDTNPCRRRQYLQRSSRLMTIEFSSWRMGRRAGAGFFAGFFLGLAALLLMAGLGGPAHAAGKRRVGVSLNGMPAGPIRAAIGDVLKKHGFEATVPDLSGDSEDAIASAAKQSKLSAVI